MQLGLLGDLLVALIALQQFLHQVDAPAGAIALVAQQLIGRAGGVAEAAMHAGAQNAIGLENMRLGAGGFGKMGLHDDSLPLWRMNGPFLAWKRTRQLA